MSLYPVMLTIKGSDLQKIFSHCNSVLPDEACGILAGHAGIIEQVYPMSNAEASPSFYRMDPQEQFNVMKKMRRADLDLVGIYHSHTDSRAYPSMTDVSLAYYPEAVYVIVAADDRKSFHARGYAIVDGDVAEVPLNVLEA